MHITKQWTQDDGTQVRLMLFLQGGFGEVRWRAFVDIKPKRKKKWIPVSDWRTVMRRSEMWALQQDLCDHLCAIDPM